MRRCVADARPPEQAACPPPGSRRRVSGGLPTAAISLIPGSKFREEPWWRHPVLLRYASRVGAAWLVRRFDTIGVSQTHAFSMRTLRHFLLHLEPPQFRWVPLRLELDDFVLECGASGAMSDPIDEMLALLEYAARPRPISRGPSLNIWLEPDGYSLDCRATSDTSSVAMRLQYYKYFYPPDHGSDDRTAVQAHIPSAMLRDGLSNGLAGILHERHMEALDRWADPQPFGRTPRAGGGALLIDRLHLAQQVR